MRWHAQGLILLASMALSGCHSQPAPGPAAEDGRSRLFEEGLGIRLSDGSAQLPGFQLTAVVETRRAPQLRMPAQVYHVGGDGRPGAAVGWLESGESARLKPGQPVTLEDAGAITTGKLVRLDNHAYGAMGRIEALIEFADPASHWKVGAVVTSTFVTGEARPVMVVPETAVLNASDGDWVYVRRGEHLRRTRVRIGASVDGLVEVEEGLQVGDSVAAMGVADLWLIELSAINGGAPCCPAPKKDTSN